MICCPKNETSNEKCYGWEVLQLRSVTAEKCYGWDVLLLRSVTAEKGDGWEVLRLRNVTALFTTRTNNIYWNIVESSIKRHNPNNQMGGVMVSVLASSAVDCGFEPRSGQTKDYEFGICYFSAKHAALRRKSKNWLARNRDNVSEWSDMCLSSDCCFNELAL
jgi:hypothetical protein